MAAAPVPVTDLLTPDREPAPTSVWRSVTATGSFLTDQQMYVRLRQFNGSDAREVVVPFQLADGTRVLIDRGYILAAELADGVPPPAPPPGEVTVVGRVSPDQPDPLRRPAQTVAGRSEVYGIDTATLLGGSPNSRLGFVQLSAGSPAVLEPIGVPDRDGGPFLSYALQWCVFGAAALLAVGVFAFREATEIVDSPAPEKTGSPAGGSEAGGSEAGGSEAGGSKAAGFRKSDLYD